MNRVLNERTIRNAVAVGAAGLLLCAARLSPAQGNLEPPLAPAPMFKTLADAEARVPISAAPFTITNPGSYYLTRNLTSTGQGIVIRADRVTLDLNGFFLQGPGSGYGIHIAGATNNPRRDIAVRNGTIGSFGTGLFGERVLGGRFEDLMVITNNGRGIALYAVSGRCDRIWIERCVMAGNASDGILLLAHDGEISGVTVQDCIVRENGLSGIYLVAQKQQGRCFGNVVRGCLVASNGGRYLGPGILYGGILLEGREGGACEANRVEDCLVSEHPTNAAAVALDGTEAICRGNVVEGCTLYGNRHRSVSLGCAEGNRFEALHIAGPDPGSRFLVGEATNTWFFANSCVGHPVTNYYFLSYDHVYGPIVTNVGALPPTGAAAHAWANFSF